MARSQNKAEAVAVRPHAAKASNDHVGSNTWTEFFSRASCMVAHWAGKPIAFLTATALVILWALTGPLFGFSDTWQLVINTSTTIVTFLMVFLIQNTQNRDTLALQVKLSELILVISEAENRFANAEDLTEEELEQLHKELHQRAQTTLGALDRRRAEQSKRAS
jgi:low affinity Fe/Cu permease